MRTAALALLVACGRIDFDARGDAANDAMADAFVLPTQPFGPPVPLDVLNTPGVEDDEPTLTSDMLVLIFESERTGSDRLYMSRRNAITDPWEPAIEILDGNSPMLTGDGLTLYYQDLNLPYVTTRSSRDEAFQLGQQVAGIPMEFKVSTITADGLLAYLTFYNGTNSYDIYTATRSDVGATFSAPVPVAPLTTSQADGNPHLFGADSQLVLSTRGIAGARMDDLAISSIVDGVHQPPVLLPEVNSDVDEEDPWMSPDGRVLYFMSFADDPAGDLYMATR